MILLNKLVAGLLLTLTLTVVVNAQITEVEYFIDEDPGIGLGTSLGFTGSTIDQTINIPTSTLSEGFHFISVRAQNSGSTWSVQSTIPFYISNSHVLTLENLTAMEYFFDDDPGIGNGQPVTNFTSGSPSVDITESLPTSALSVGFHNLTIRTQDENGNWGIIQSKPIYVTDGDVTSIQDIQAIEYFIDSDPGIGAGVAIPIGTGLQTVDLTETIPTTGLSNGIHYLTIRVQDSYGVWGISSSRVFNVMNGQLTTTAEIIAGEYYFDVDPGIGQAAPISFDNATTIDSVVTANSSTLSSGSHVVGYRVMDSDSVWSMQYTRMVYIDKFSAFAPIDKVEYFLNEDPGFGNGTIIEVPDSSFIDSLITVATSTLDTGTYSISFRAVNTDTLWGITETHQFVILPSDSCDADSTILVDIYNSTDGPTWNNNSGWLTGPVTTWAGVTIKGCTVDNLNLSSNNLSGTIPETIGEFNSLTCLDLSGNNFADSITSSILNNTGLTCLDLSNNSLTSLPVFTGSAITNLNVDSNSLSFSDLEAITFIDTVTYNNQSQLTQDTSLTLNTSEALNLTFTTDGTANSYQWFKDGIALIDETLNALSISSVSITDSGTYRCEISNSIATGALLSTGTFHLTVIDLGPCAQDSLALVALYNSSGGSNWGVSNWLSSPLAQWEGIRLTGCRVDSISLANGNLEGSITGQLGYLDSLRYLDLSGNNLSGAVPDSISLATNLSYLNLSMNNLTVLPEFGVAFDSLDVSNNAFDFEDLEINASQLPFSYAPQGNLGNDTTLFLTTGDTLKLEILTGGLSNTYSWTHNGLALTDKTDSLLLINAITLQDSGDYVLTITNSSFPDLTLTSGTFKIIVSNSNLATDTGSTTTDPINFYALEDIKNATPDCDQFDISITETSELGTFEIIGDSSIKFTPKEGAPIGSDTISFIAQSLCSDSTLINDEFIVTLNNAAPELLDLDEALKVPDDGLFRLDLKTNLFDFNKNEILDSLRILSFPGSGVNAEIDLNYFLNVDYSSTSFRGTDTILIQACDSLGLCVQKRVILDFTFNIEVFNAVSPNNDSEQDFFFIKNIDRYPDATVNIYSTWGDEIWNNEGIYYDNKTGYFDGHNSKGNEVPEGTYYYIIELGIENDPCRSKYDTNKEFKCNGFLLIKRD